jgi:hypothetical protein
MQSGLNGRTVRLWKGAVVRNRASLFLRSCCGAVHVRTSVTSCAVWCPFLVSATLLLQRLRAWTAGVSVLCQLAYNAWTVCAAEVLHTAAHTKMHISETCVGSSMQQMHSCGRRKSMQV